MYHRKSTVNLVMTPRSEKSLAVSSAVELERLEQETTLVLQEIDRNLSRANAVINEKIFPVLKKYAVATGKVRECVGFWKSFMEDAAETEIRLLTDKPPAGPTHGTTQLWPPTLHSPIQNDNDASAVSDTLSSNADPDTSTPNRAAVAAQPLLLPESHSVSACQHQRQNRLSFSPRKRTPERPGRRTSDRCLVDSSPPIPERPVLLSDAGKQATHSSSFVGRVASTSSDSEGDNAQLGRLSPINFGNITTPQTASKKRPDHALDFKVPTLPTLLSVQKSKRPRPSHAEKAPARGPRYSDQHRDLIEDINDPNGQFNLAPPRMTSGTYTALSASRAPNPSETQSFTRTYDTADTSGSPIKRNALMHEFENDTNVFTVNDRVTATITADTEFHTVGEQPPRAVRQPSRNRTAARSLSQLIEDVLDQDGNTAGNPDR
ncbi:hypothetical protein METBISCDRAFT_21491 [Metschnikowia bicuspidata]|uniref:DASH complex subunit ASK1 n=1 Tax=Metschnikowia bicuspidata TaxID=27322 RepID=A0A4V1J3L8_9ASCO|nr:hypothetical protein METBISCDRAFT_21491 [Metschnikowia bicuspidata]